MRLVTALRGIAQRFALPMLVLASAVMILLGKADALLFDRMRVAVGDAVAPVMDVLSRPVTAVDNGLAYVKSLANIQAENVRLREENARLLRWQQTALNLASENDRLREILKLSPDPAQSFVTARVVANSGGSWKFSVLVNAGQREGVVRGQAAITGEGLVGRIAEVGERASRVLLLTDLNSHIPVLVESSRERAVLAGDNSEQPRLLYLPARSQIRIGDRITTSGHGGIFPPGVPVGVVASTDNGIVRIEPYAELSRIDFVRIVDYGLSGVLPQPVQPIVRAGKGKKGQSPDGQPGAEEAR
jgi:rod shape-determining protein MreC